MTENAETQKEHIGTVTGSPVTVHKQYLKDLSFENPNAPDILLNVNGRPGMDMDIALDAHRVENEQFDHFYEVTLGITAKGTREDKTLFIAEISYGAVVSIEGIEEKNHHPVLFIEVPNLLFPYVRHILATCSMSGGFTPLQIAPINFRAMYLQRFGKKKEEG